MIVRSRRPLWTVGFTWALVCLIGMWLPTSWLSAAVGLAVLSLTLTVCIKRLRCYREVLLIFGTIAIAATVLLYTEITRYQPVVQACGTNVSFSAVVQTDTAMPEIRVLSGDLPANTVLRLWSNSARYTLQQHDVFEGTFTLQAFDTEGLATLQAKASGVWCAAIPTNAESVVPIGRQTSTVLSSLATWRKSVAADIQRLLPRDVGAVISGICLGEDAQLSLDATSNFRTCGVSHLFAVSGLHLSILTQTLMALFKAMRVPRRMRGALGTVAVLGFTLLMGQTASVTRAGVMCLVVMLGDCFRRQADARNSLGLGLLLLLVAEPFAVYDAGLLLSFLATFGILFLSPWIQEQLLRIPIPSIMSWLWKPLCAAMAVTAAASVATLPVMVLYFGMVSLVSILANPIITFPATMILVLGWITIPFVTLGMEWVYRPLLIVLGWLSRGVLWITERLAALPYSKVEVLTTPTIVWLLGSIPLIYGGYRLFRYRGACIAVTVSVGMFCISSFLL